MTISSRTPEGQPDRCPVCRHRLRLSPSWPTADAPCPRCGSLVWFPTANAARVTAEPAPEPDFTLNDFRRQLEQLKRLGPLRDGRAGVPGVGDGIDASGDPEQGLRRLQGMIDAMTQKERANPDILDGSRCRRIAAGAGVPRREVERFLGQFRQVRVLMKQMAQMNLWRDGGV